MMAECPRCKEWFDARQPELHVCPDCNGTECKKLCGHEARIDELERLLGFREGNFIGISFVHKRLSELKGE